MAPYISESMKRRALLDKELYPIEFNSYKPQKAKKIKHLIKDKRNHIVQDIINNEVSCSVFEKKNKTIHFQKIKCCFIVNFFNIKERINIFKELEIIGWVINYDKKDDLPYLSKYSSNSFYRTYKSAKSHFYKHYSIGSNYLISKIEKLKEELPLSNSLGYSFVSIEKKENYKIEILESIPYNFVENEFVGYKFNSNFDKKYQKHFYGTNLELRRGAITNNKDIYLSLAPLWHKKRRKKGKVYPEKQKYNKLISKEKDFSWNDINYSKENWRAELALNMLV